MQCGCRHRPPFDTRSKRAKIVKQTKSSDFNLEKCFCAKIALRAMAKSRHRGMRVHAGQQKPAVQKAREMNTENGPKNSEKIYKFREKVRKKFKMSCLRSLGLVWLGLQLQKKKKKPSTDSETRTHSLLFRRQMAYPLAYAGKTVNPLEKVG